MHADWNLYSKLKSLAAAACPCAVEKGMSIVLLIRPATIPTAAPGITGCWHLEKIRHLKDTGGEIISAAFKVLFLPGRPVRAEVHQNASGLFFLKRFDRFGFPVESTPLPAGGRKRNDGSRVEAAAAPEPAGPCHPKPEAMDKTPVFFGDFHWHTEFSDGQQTLAESLKNARDRVGLDFAGPGDHMGCHGHFGDREYREQASVCTSFNQPGEFAVLPALEFSHRHGHVHLVTESFDIMERILSAFPGRMAGAVQACPDRFPWDILLQLCVPGKSILRPCHPAIDSGSVVRPEDRRSYWYSFNWPAGAEHRFARSVEIARAGASSETEEQDPAWLSFRTGFGGSVRTALARGYRLGFSGGSDDHRGWPGLKALTAIQARSLDTASIFRALYERRCYATSGARMVADATLNGMPLGSELRLEPDTPRKIVIRIRGTAPLVQVQIISAGIAVADFNVSKNSDDFSCEWVDERPGRHLENVYYYVRARQSDGHCAWLSPFWIDRPAA